MLERHGVEARTLDVEIGGQVSLEAVRDELRERLDHEEEKHRPKALPERPIEGKEVKARPTAQEDFSTRRATIHRALRQSLGGVSADAWSLGETINSAPIAVPPKRFDPCFFTEGTYVARVIITEIPGTTIALEKVQEGRAFAVQTLAGSGDAYRVIRHFQTETLCWDYTDDRLTRLVHNGSSPHVFPVEVTEIHFRGAAPPPDPQEEEKEP